jgi:nitrate reductase (cytochrome), electron transfer subunit
VTSPNSGPGRVVLPVFLIGSAVTAVAAVVVAVRRVPPRRPAAPEPIVATTLAPPAESIAAEAQVFRTRAGMMAIAFAARREREAHPRTLESFRYLRAYPGAPPRIPHELTPEEFRSGACTTCHERGGYSRRFAAYVPVTPHPGRGECLQCHVGDDAVMAVPLVSPDPDRRCHQCHGRGGSPRAEADALLDWRTTAWPQLARRTPDRISPPIPHDLQSRGNCLACHAGPAAVSEIRTTHPERADCRQCHVATDPEAGAFTRAAAAAEAGTRGAR